MQKQKSAKYEFPFPEQAITQLQKSYSHQKFYNYLSNDVVDRAMGCLFGSFIGDVLGAYLEFAKEKTFPDMMKNVMEMPGGGIFSLKKGQVTDDSQLAFHLLNALTDSFKPFYNFEEMSNKIILNIAKQYLDWGKSRPFDIGSTCRKGIQAIKSTYQQMNIESYSSFLNLQKDTAKIISEQVHKNVIAVNSQSQSNGSIMRMAPMHFFFGIINNDKHFQQGYVNKQLNLKRQLMKKFVRDQISLLHCNIKNIDISYRWFTLVLALIKRQNNNDIFYIEKYSFMEFQKLGFDESLNIDARINIGWVKIAVSLGLSSLKKIIKKNLPLNENLYLSQIENVLSKGGDTDTNAAIVGGLLGALVGFKNLPGKYLFNMMNLRHKDKSDKRCRTQFYEPRSAFLNAYKLIDKYLNNK